MANGRNNPVPRKDLGNFSSLAILSTLPGEQTSSLWERKQQLLLLRALCKIHSPLQVTKQQVNRFFYYSLPGEAEKWWQWVCSSCHCLALGYICGDPMLWRIRKGERNFWGASLAPQIRDLLVPSTALWWFFILRQTGWQKWANTSFVWNLVDFKQDRAVSLHTQTSKDPVVLLPMLAVQLLKLWNIFGQSTMFLWDFKN